MVTTEADEITAAKCEKQANSGDFNTELDKIMWPDGLEDLWEQWGVMSRQAVEEVAGSEEEFVSCVVARSRSAYDLNSQMATSESCTTALPSRLHPFDPPAIKIPAPDEPTTEAWDAYEDEEQRYLKAAWDCQEPVYDEAMQTLFPAVAEFESDHAEPTG